MPFAIFPTADQNININNIDELIKLYELARKESETIKTLIEQNPKIEIDNLSREDQNTIYSWLLSKNNRQNQSNELPLESSKMAVDLHPNVVFSLVAWHNAQPVGISWREIVAIIFALAGIWSYVKSAMISVSDACDPEAILADCDLAQAIFRAFCVGIVNMATAFSLIVNSLYFLFPTKTPEIIKPFINKASSSILHKIISGIFSCFTAVCIAEGVLVGGDLNFFDWLLLTTGFMSNWLQYIEGSSLFIDALFSRSTYARCCPATKNPRQIEQRQSAMETLETLLKKNSDMKNQDDTSYYETIPSVEDGNIQQTDADSSQETDKHRCSLVDVVYYKLLRPLTKYTLTLFVVEGITPFFLEGASGIKELLGEEPKYLGLLVPMVFTLGSLVFKAAYNTFEALLKKVDELVESLVNCRNEFSLPAEFWYAPITYSISLSVTLGLSCFSFYGMVGLLLANIDLLSDFADFIKIDESFLYNLTFYAAHFAPVIFNFFFFIDKVLRLFSHLARSGKFGETAKESAINREYLKQLMQLVNISNPETLEKIEFSEHNLGSDIESLPKMENNIADGLKVERNGIFNCCSPSNEVEHQPLLGNNGAPATYSAV